MIKEGCKNPSNHVYLAEHLIKSNMKYNEQELNLKFGVKALRGIEKELGKLLADIGKQTTVKDKDGNDVPSIFYSIDEALIILKHGLNCEFSDEQCEEIMEQNDGCFFTVSLEFQKAAGKAYSIANAGNSEVPQN